MAEEEVKFTIPNDHNPGTDGSIVDVVFTYNTTANSDGSFTVTDARGTYETLDTNQNVVDMDTITGIAPPSSDGGNDNELFINSEPTVMPIVTGSGIDFVIDNTADTPNHDGDINFYDIGGQSPPDYGEFERADGATGVTETAICYVQLTLMSTVRGNVAVNDLVIGDLAISASGAFRPVRWLGHRTIDCRRHPHPHSVMPVRIFAHAFGSGLPGRDLFLSPGHPVLVGADEDGNGGYLVPIMCLINGTTIERVKVDEVTYWHVELDEHDILLAEGLPAESYIDLGSRAWFDGVDGALHDPDMALPGMPGRCRPVAIDGPVVEAERRRLDAVFAIQLVAPCAWPTRDRLSLT